MSPMEGMGCATTDIFNICIHIMAKVLHALDAKVAMLRQQYDAQRRPHIRRDDAGPRADPIPNNIKAIAIPNPFHRTQIAGLGLNVPDDVQVAPVDAFVPPPRRAVPGGAPRRAGRYDAHFLDGRGVDGRADGYAAGAAFRRQRNFWNRRVAP